MMRFALTMIATLLPVALAQAADMPGVQDIASKLAAPQSAPPSAPRGAPMTTQAYQGRSCIVLGTLTTIGVYIYSDVITEVLTGAVVNAVLLIPVMALGFASGCSVGSTMGPGVQWIVQQFQ